MSKSVVTLPRSAPPVVARESGIVQRKCACGGKAGPTGECDECAKRRETLMRKESGSGGTGTRLPRLQRRLAIGASNDQFELEADRVAEEALSAPMQVDLHCAAPHIQRLSGGETGQVGQAPPSVDRALANPGAPLEPLLQADMSQRFGHDFSKVRVHCGAEAERSAKDVNAHAYTVGQDVVFGASRYAPGTDDGRRLIAHELTHVVQQDAAPPRVQRSSCPHDEPFGSGCGVFQWNGPAGELADFVHVGTDRIITAKLPDHLGGTWVPQLHSPPNLAKGGTSHGFVDAAKVSITSDLAVDVLEIKSRNTVNGGCALATTETKGYLQALRPLAPHVVSLSAGLAKAGGLRTDECRNITAAERTKLVTAGLDVNNPDSVRAWCLYNDLQNKLNRTFTAGFGNVTFSMNQDGKVNTDYVVGIVPITCKRGNKTVAGTKKLIFEVNTKGGLSYRCEKRCGGEKEKEKEKEKEMPKEVELPADKALRGVEQPDHEDDYDPIEDDIRFPSSGIDVTDVAIVTTLGVATVVTVHILMQKAKTEAEKKALKVVAEKTIEKMARNGASQTARHLNSKNITKIGTRAYEQAIKKAEEETAKRLARTTEEKVAKRLATRLSKTAAKNGAKAIFKAAGKALPVIGILLTAKDVFAAVDAISKGAEISIGFSGSVADLGSGTDIKIKGDKSKGGATTDVTTEQTEVDIEMAKAPDIKGLMELETKEVKIKGKVDGRDGDPVTVNLKVKIEDSTVTFRSTGKFKGGNIVIDGGLEISNSEIEIDLPPDAVLEPPQPGMQRVIKGVKVKVTKVGSGMGPAATGGQGSAGTAKDQPGSKDKPPPVSDERKKLLDEVQGDPGVKKIYDTIVRPKGILISDEVLRRLLALKAQLKAHPELVDRVIALLQKAPLKDPIKDLIEPMEAEIKRALEEQARSKQPTPPPAGDVPSDKPAKETPPVTPQPTPQVDRCKDAEKFDLWTLLDIAQGKSGTLPPDTAVRLGKKTFDETEKSPTPTAASPIELGRKTAEGLRKYTVWLHGKDMKPLKSFDTKLFIWAAEYEFTAPTGPIDSDQGDKPICFNDGGTTRRLVWGRYHKQKN